MVDNESLPLSDMPLGSYMLESFSFDSTGNLAKIEWLRKDVIPEYEERRWTIFSDEENIVNIKNRRIFVNGP